MEATWPLIGSRKMLQIGEAAAEERKGLEVAAARGSREKLHPCFVGLDQETRTV